MDKININDSPSLDGVSLVPTKVLQLIVDIYNDEVDKGKQQFENRVKQKACLIKERKAKAYSDTEFFELLEREGL